MKFLILLSGLSLLALASSVPTRGSSPSASAPSRSYTRNGPSATPESQINEAQSRSLTNSRNAGPSRAVNFIPSNPFQTTKSRKSIEVQSRNTASSSNTNFVPTNPFLTTKSRTSFGSFDKSEEVLSTKDTIKILTGFLPALTKALVDDNSTAAEKMMDITVAFLPLARDVVESRAEERGRTIDNEEVQALEYAEQAVGPFMQAMVDYVDELPTVAPFEFDTEELLDSIPQVDLPKFDGPLIPEVEIPEIRIPEVEIPDFNFRG